MLHGLSSWLFDPSGLTPHGFCLLWQPGLLWTHALSDFAIGLAYFSIPFVLIAVMRLRRDILYRPLFGLFAAFILLCGAGHWLDLLTLWVPVYGIEGVVKAATAITSIATAMVLWKLLPQALKWPSPEQLAQVRTDLFQVKRLETQTANIARQSAEACDALALELLRREAAERDALASKESYRIQAVTLAEVNERLSMTANTGAIGIWDWNVVEDRLTWDPWMYRLHGMAPSDEKQSFSSWQEHLHPDDRAATVQAMTDALFGGPPFVARFRIVWSDGTVHHIRNSVPKVTTDDAGRITRMIGTNWDCSEQSSLSEQRSLVMESAPNGMMIIDEGGVITLVNSAMERLFGYAAGELPGQSVEILVPDAIRATHGAMRSKFTSGETDRAMAAGRPFIGRRRDGSAVSIEIMLKSVKTPLGRTVVASVFDVTDRQRLADEKLAAEMRERQKIEDANVRLDRLAQHLAKARNQAQEATRAKSRFLAGMSHELRTPLNGILGYAHLMRMDGDLNASQEQRVAAMLEAGKHLLEMIACVLDISEIEAAQVTLHEAEIEPRTVGMACLDLVRPAAEAKHLALRLISTDDAPDKVLADATRLRQVLLNLLSNAVKFTTQGSVEVRLGSSADGAILSLEVADTGRGISAEQHDRLFQDFERLASDVGSGVEGSGLGLALSYRLAELMGGKLTHRDNAGGGSIFALELPLHHVASTCPEGLEVPQAPDAGRVRSRRILVVDDVLMNRDIAESFLRIAGHAVTTAESGPEAIAAIRNTEFDIVLMDVRMPGMDGLQATRLIRQLEGPRAGVTIIALTAQAFTTQISDCLAAGMNGHLAKPFTPDGLFAVIKEAADQIDRGNSQPPPALAPKARAATQAKPVLPYLDVRAFEEVTAVLTPQKVEAFLRRTALSGESLLVDLQAVEEASGSLDELVEEVHRFTGSAGMFGFTRLSDVGRRFEQAVAASASDAGSLAGELGIAIEGTCQEIYARL